MSASPKFKNLTAKPKQSPKELKEKMRKYENSNRSLQLVLSVAYWFYKQNYKNKIQNCRGMIMDKLRKSFVEEELCNTLTDIYKAMFNYSGELINEEEYKVMEEIKNEIIQEELEWLSKEYEKSQMDNIDWSSIEEDNNVICPVCCKENLKFVNNALHCSCCKFIIKTQKSLPEIKHCIITSVEEHHLVCSNDAQFGTVGENIYLICDICMDMKLII